MTKIYYKKSRFTRKKETFNITNHQKEEEGQSDSELMKRNTEVRREYREVYEIYREMRERSTCFSSPSPSGCEELASIHTL